jgi:hypothetical protein
LGAKSRAIAATLSAVLLFTPLILANSLLYWSAGERLLLASAADRNAEIVQSAKLLLYYSSYEAVLRLNTIMANGTAPCQLDRSLLSAPGHSENFSGNISGYQYSLKLTFTLAEFGSPKDNMTALHPYEGFVPGSLNLRLHLVLVLGNDADFGYRRDEVHFLHLPKLYSCSL